MNKMKVHAELDKCEGYANCVVAAPNVFSIDDDENLVIVTDPSPPEDKREAVEEAVRNCPTTALSIMEE
jgi:ferredoxin